MEHRNHTSTYSVLTDALDPGERVNRLKHFFSESSHVAYQSKGIGAQSTTQAHILSLHTTSTQGMGSKGQIFFSESSHVAYQIKESGAYSTMQTHPRPLG